MTKSKYPTVKVPSPVHHVVYSWAYWRVDNPIDYDVRNNCRLHDQNHRIPVSGTLILVSAAVDGYDQNVGNHSNYIHQY